MRRSVVDERAEWLRANGHTIESGPEEYDYTPGYYAVFFYDPDGIKLEIVHRPREQDLVDAGPRARGAARQAGGQLMPTWKPAYLIHGDDHGRIAERRASLRERRRGRVRARAGRRCSRATTPRRRPRPRRSAR